MEGHDLIGGPHKRPSDEHCWNRCWTTQPSYSFLHFLAFRVFVNFMNHRYDSKFLEQNVDCIAEATRALGENHHTLFCGQPHNLFHLDDFARDKKHNRRKETQKILRL